MPSKLSVAGVVGLENSDPYDAFPYARSRPNEHLMTTTFAVMIVTKVVTSRGPRIWCSRTTLGRDSVMMSTTKVSNAFTGSLVLHRDRMSGTMFVVPEHRGIFSLIVMTMLSGPSVSVQAVKKLAGIYLRTTVLMLTLISRHG